MNQSFEVSHDPHPSSLPIANLTATELVAAYRARTLSPVEVVQTLMERVEAVDRLGPNINSVLALSDFALEAARIAEKQYQNGTQDLPLLGVPIMVKDNIDTRDIDTTAGSLAFRKSPRPSTDAAVVAKIRDAGGIIFAKTNLSEWSNFRGKRSSSGWSGLGGQTRNPHALDRSPGGSSAGSAAAVAARLAPVALGSETDGSINCPASLNGVVGLKPGVGRVSRRGVIPISSSQDTVGSLSRSVADARIMLDVMSGLDPSDAHSVEYFRVDSASFDTARPARIGALSRATSEFSTQNLTLYQESLELLESHGFIVVRGIDEEDGDAIDHSGPDETLVLITEMSESLGKYLADRGAPGASTIAEIVEFNMSHSKEELLFYGQEYLEAAVQSAGITSVDYLQAVQRNQELTRSGIDKLLSKYQLDAIVAPTMDPSWLIDQVLGDRRIPSCYSPAAVAGYPTITIPMGSIFGLPVGMLFFGALRAEPQLLAIAESAEVCLNYSGIVSYSESTQIH